MADAMGIPLLEGITLLHDQDRSVSNSIVVEHQDITVTTRVESVERIETYHARLTCAKSVPLAGLSQIRSPAVR